jgi:DHA2 family multidrug resistance protein-like MFS transporter
METVMRAQADIGSRKWWALGALALSLMTVGLDLTILNVALPTLAEALDASTGQLQWFADAYNLVLAAALLPAGLLGDRFGRKRMLLIALSLFGAASLACSFADSSGQLIAGRALLGLGAAALMPLSMSILPVLFTPAERPRALTIWVTANSLGIPLGPIVGGWLLDHYRWGSVFLINVPVVLIGLVAIAVLLPESRDPRRPRIDVPGVITSSLGLVGVTYGVIQGGENGWGEPSTLLTLAVGVASLGAFALRQLREGRRPGGQPLVDLALFRSPSFTWGGVLATLSTFAMFGVLFAMPQYLHAVIGTDALGTGLRLLPIIAGLLVGAQVSDRIAPRVGPAVTVAIGFALLAGGLLSGATTEIDSSYGFAAAWMTVLGAGLGFALPAAMDAAIGALSPERSGVGSALLMAMRQVGGTIGVAVLGTVLASGYRDALGDAVPEAARESVSAGAAVAHQVGSPSLLASVQSAFIEGMDAMLWVCGGVAVLAAVLALRFLPRRRGASVPHAETAESVHELAA